MLAMLLALWAWSAALAAPAGLVLTGQVAVSWTPAGLSLWPQADLRTPLYDPWTPAQGQIVDVVPWGGDLLVLVSAQVRSLYLVDLQAARVQLIRDLTWVQAIGRDPDSGRALLVGVNGSVWWLERLERGPEYALAGLRADEPAAKQVLGTATHQVRALRARTFVGAGPLGLCVTELLDGGARAICGRGPQEAVAVAPLDAARLVTLERHPQGEQLTRWSLLHPLAPWPFPLGSTPAPEGCTALVPLERGAWLVCPGPLRTLPGLPGVVVGSPEGQGRILAAAALPEDPTALLTLQEGEGGALTLRPLAAPEVEPGPPGPLGEPSRLYFGDWRAWGESLGPVTPAAQALAERYRRDDLPMGIDADVTNGSMPAWVRSTVQGLLDRASPWSMLPLSAAFNYLEQFPDQDGDLDQALAQTERRVEQQRLALLLALGVGGTLGVWVYRRLARRLSQRDEVLAAAYNPFRQDSPNNPERTPFAANRLVDDLIRTLDLNAVVVEGPPFGGKSALLRHLAWRLEREGLGGRPVAVVRVSLYGVPEDELWTRLGRAIAERFPGAEAAEEVRALDTLDRGAVEYLLDEVLSEAGPRLVLVLDDLDALGGYQVEAQRFRGLLQVVPSQRMSVLGSGQSIRRGYAGSEDESPWFNLFQVRTLAPLNAEELSAYLDSRLGPPFRYTPEAAARILERTGGSPLRVWHLCYAAVEHLLLHRRLELVAADVDAVGEELYAGARPPEGSPGVVAEDAHAAYERLLAQVAQARRRRDALLSELAERERRRGDSLDDDFFKGSEG